MAQFKENKKDSEIVETVGFKDIESYMAIEGLAGSFFEGKQEVVHVRLGKKLIDAKMAKEVKRAIELEVNKNRTVSEADI